MDDINGIPTDEYMGPTFSVNLHDKDGDAYCEGIYLHYGDTIIIDQMREFSKQTLIIKGRELDIPVDFKVGPSWGELEEVK